MKRYQLELRRKMTKYRLNCLSPNNYIHRTSRQIPQNCDERDDKSTSFLYIYVDISQQIFFSPDNPLQFRIIHRVVPARRQKNVITNMSNQAAWIKAPKARLEVDSAPVAKARPGEVVIKNAYVAINPVDWKVQEHGPPSQKYPNILGRDIAGEIVEVGSDVARLHVGQRVIA